MDSDNSGSMQSSSGGDEEYDSRAESISVFLNSNDNPLTHVGPMPNPPPQPPAPSNRHQHHHPSSSSMFDPLSNYFDPLSSSRSPLPQFTNPNSLVNLDMVWSKNLRSDSNCTDLAGFLPSSSPTHQFFTNHPQTRPNFPPLQIPQAPESGTRVSASASVSNDQTNNTNTAIVRNPKKRSRASRRAPTTVLTTDTTNFRAMVQEFTGIPAPPFTASHFPRSRLDLFGTASSLRSATHLESPPPPYLLRPFAQKFQSPPSFLSSSASCSSSSMVDAMACTATTNLNSATNPTTAAATSSSTALSSELGLLKHPQNLLNINMQNPILNFNSLLQPSPKFPLPNSAILGSAAATNDSHLKMGLFEEFGLNHGDGHVNTNHTGLQNMVSSSSSDTHTTLRRSDQNNWRADHEAHNQGLLRSVNANNYSNPHGVATSGKVINYSASSSDFHGDKGPENVVSRTEGMMESWICSSD